MKTIRFNTPAAWMLAGLAMLIVAGSVTAEDAGQVRLTDFGTETKSADTDSGLIIRGASDMRRRNAQTSQALRRMFRDHKVKQANMTERPGTRRRIRQVNDACCTTDACCPATCAAPVECCPPASCCAPVTSCCAPDDCCTSTCDGCCPNSCDGCAAVGRVRITDECTLCGGQGCSVCLGDGCQNGQCQYGSCRQGGYRQGHCQHGRSRGGCRVCNSGSCLNKNCFAGFMSTQAAAHRARNRMASANLNNYLRCKLGYFIHDGNGGIGSPMFGHYSIVYPVDSGYSDDRDGQVYSAQGYGGAVSVPLAPTVRHTYNYGWGIPSSRLTPVSNTTAP